MKLLSTKNVRFRAAVYSIPHGDVCRASMYGIGANSLAAPKESNTALEMYHVV
jgi:hypothetical protein